MRRIASPVTRWPRPPFSAPKPPRRLSPCAAGQRPDGPPERTQGAPTARSCCRRARRQATTPPPAREPVADLLHRKAPPLGGTGDRPAQGVIASRLSGGSACSSPGVKLARPASSAGSRARSRRLRGYRRIAMLQTTLRSAAELSRFHAAARVRLERGPRRRSRRRFAPRRSLHPPVDRLPAGRSESDERVARARRRRDPGRARRRGRSESVPRLNLAQASRSALRLSCAINATRFRAPIVPSRSKPYPQLAAPSTRPSDLLVRTAPPTIPRQRGCVTAGRLAGLFATARPIRGRSGRPAGVGECAQR